MKIRGAASLILIIGAFLCTAAPSHCEKDPYDENLRVFEGAVTAVDTRAPSITVEGGVKITFPISRDTVLLTQVNNMNACNIRLLDIEPGDYVTVEYYRSGKESRLPSKVTKVSLLYKGKKE